MKRHLPWISAVLLACASLAQAQTHPLTYDDLVAMRRIGAPQVSPDGKWVAYDASTPDMAQNRRRSAIYLVPATGGDSKQITDGTKQDEGPAWSPNGKTIAYVSNRDGNPKQVYLYDVATGQSRKVSNLLGGAGVVKWLPDGSGLVLVSDIEPECGVDPTCTQNSMNAASSKPSQGRIITNLLYRHWTQWQEATRSHILYLPLAVNGAPRDLTPGAFDAPPFSLGGGDEFDVSPDGKELVFARDTEAKHPEVSTNADLFLVPIAGGEPKRITTRSGADTGPKYSPDGKWIAWRSQARGGYESDLFELWLYNRATGATQRVLADFPNWIESIEWAPDSRSIFFTSSEKFRVPIYEVTLADGKAHQLYNQGAAGALQASRDGKAIFFEKSSLTRPADIFMLRRTSPDAVQITHDNDARLATIEMGQTSDFWFAGADNTQIQSMIVKPPRFDATKKYPAVLIIHGGPQVPFSDAWSYRWNAQMFAARGYVVMLPNPHGSPGYGQPFTEEISGDWGGKVYEDLMKGTDQLAAMPFVDGNRLGAAGASFGGYMIDWILGHTNRFKALVSHDGVYNLESMYGVTEELWFPEFEFHGNPWDNPELYQKWSPNRHVKNFATPTLVVQGEQDFRVPVNQGLELFTALQRRDIPSKLLYFPDEGHWVLKPQNSKLWYDTVLGWLDQWVKK